MVDSIAPILAYTYPIDINITIYSCGNEFEATILANGIRGPQSFSIELTQYTVEQLNAALRQAIDEARKNCEENGGVEIKFVQQLADVGQYAFNKIFRDGKALLYQILELIQRRSRPTIEIASKNFFIPWELLYDGLLGTRTDISCFWGMRYLISRTIIQRQRAGALASPLIQAPRPKVGLIACNEDTLENVTRKEIPMLQGLDQENQIFLVPLRPLDINQRDQELEYFGHFLAGEKEELQITHLACHSLRRNPDNRSRLEIANDFPITLEDFGARNFVIKHSPLVILNACLTGIIDTLSISGWAAEFWNLGARGVLATEFRVPDWFAADFIEELYKQLLAGTPIGEALWATRNRFWEQKRNPLGLAYALYSPLAIRLVR